MNIISRSIAIGVFVLQHSFATFGAGADADTVAKRTVASQGGVDKLLRTLKFDETYLFPGREKGTDRTHILQPPHFWCVGKTERVSESGKGGVCHDVWMWTLAPIVDPKTKLESLPDSTIEGKAVHGLKVSGSIETPMGFSSMPRRMTLQRSNGRASSSFSAHQWKWTARVCPRSAR